MTFRGDGTVCSVWADEGPVVCIGWLDGSQQFESGEVSEEFASALSRACREPVRVTRGWHRCPFCRDAVVGGTRVRDADGEFLVGHAEIRVRDRDGFVYAAPDMVIHYVLEHGYLPPGAFQAAVIEAGR